jgi:hypothetical protein
VAPGGPPEGPRRVIARRSSVGGIEIDLTRLSTVTIFNHPIGYAKNPSLLDFSPLKQSIREDITREQVPINTQLREADICDRNPYFFKHPPAADG